jgi:hypothetical protein
MQPRAENDRTAANPGDIIMRKAWDRSPVVDPWAFDPTQPPETAVPLPPQYALPVAPAMAVPSRVHIRE